ncbi:MAG: PAS domain-containing protein [Candidatus Kapabacteria bacterium]|nr:PAS domain-containing protein [Candidatus Kapabacteria bacterium]
MRSKSIEKSEYNFFNYNSKQLLIIAVIAIIYFLTTFVTFVFSSSQNLISPIWPAAGIGLAALLLNHRKLWPALIIAIFISGNIANIISGKPLVASFGFMTANILESLLSAILLTKLGNKTVKFETLKEILSFFTIPTLVNALTALIGATTAYFATNGTFLDIWFTWWVADGLGLLIITPLIISWSDFSKLKSISSKQIKEILIFLFIWCLATYIFFHVNLPRHFKPQPFFLVALLGWPSLRMGLRVITLSILILAFSGLSSDMVINGPLLWGGNDLQTRILLFQMFLAIVTSSVMLLTVSHLELKSSKEKSDEKSLQISALSNNLPNGMVFQFLKDFDSKMRFIYVSEAARQLTGFEPDQILENSQLMFDQVHPDDLEIIYKAQRESAKNLTIFNVIVRFYHLSGELRWMQISSKPRKLDDGRIIWDGIQFDISDRIKIERELAESQSLYSNLVETADDVILLTDMNGRHIFRNKAYYTSLGYNVGEELEPDGYSLVHPDDLSMMQDAVKELIINGNCTTEYRVKHRDGYWINRLSKSKIIYDEFEQAQTILAIIRDNTELKRKENITHARLKLLELANNCSLDELLTATLDEIERLTESSIAFYHFVDKDKKNLSLQAWSTNTLATLCTSELNGGHLPIDLAGVWVDCVNQRQPVIHNDYSSLPYKKEFPVGHACVTREILIPIFRGESIVAILGIGNKQVNYTQSDLDIAQQIGDLSWDIVSRKRTEDELVQRETSLKFSQKVAHVGNWTWNMISNRLTWSDELFNIFDIDKGSFDGDLDKVISSSIHPDDREKVIESNALAFSETSPKPLEYRIITKDDKVKKVIAIPGSRKVDSQGKAIELYGIVQDISEQKKTELELSQAKDKAEKADQQKTIFLQNLSHDIRTPINGILGFAQLLKEEKLNDEERFEYADIIIGSGNRLLNFINNILDISKIESNKMEILNEEFNLNQILIDLQRFNNIFAKENGISLNLSCQLPNEESIIISDKTKLGRILQNLVGNAMKFTAKGSIDFGYQIIDDFIEFYVKDTGAGIEKELQSKIFERFYQIDPNIPKKDSSTGLGLSIVSGFVQLMGGKVWLESELGKGSNFYFTIPFNLSC